MNVDIFSITNADHLGRPVILQFCIFTNCLVMGDEVLYCAFSGIEDYLCCCRT